MTPEFELYAFEYRHEGATWTIEIPAKSAADAQARVNKMPHAKLLGTVVARIPAGGGWLVRFTCWFRNALFGASSV